MAVNAPDGSREHSKRPADRRASETHRPLRRSSDDGFRSSDHSPLKHRKTEIHVDRTPDGSFRELRRETMVHEKPDGSQVVTQEETRSIKGVGVAKASTASARATATRPPRPVRRERVREVYVREHLPINRWGPARIMALCVGTAFAAIGLAEAYLYTVTSDWAYGGTTLLVGSLELAVLHGVVGLLLLGAGLAYEGAAKGIVRLFGVTLMLGAIVGLLAREYIGTDLLALDSGLFPWSHINFYAFAGLLCLIVGFAPRMNATKTVERKIEPQEEPVERDEEPVAN